MSEYLAQNMKADVDILGLTRRFRKRNWVAL